MHVDYINMVKFKSESDSSYQTVLDHLLLMAACEQVTASVGGRIRKAGWTRTVLSEIGFPSRAVATKFAPQDRQGLFGPTKRT
jgi:hypothetical protein